ncbi:MAG: hypothetical protein JSR41_08810 [Proteobacteria bacterium]|nr:hypothetical protein [Pseudomonadota bacterium]
MQLPDVRRECVVRDMHRKGWIAGVLPWSGKSVDLARFRCWIDWALGPVVAGCMHLLPKLFVPPTEQGEPDRLAILDLP